MVPSDPSEDASSQTSSEALLSQESRLHGGTLTIHPDGHTYTYSYGPKCLTGLLHNYYALGCAVFVSIGGLLFGYDQGVIANVLVMKDFTQRWPIGAWEKGIMSTSRDRIFCKSESQRNAVQLPCLSSGLSSGLSLPAY